MNIATTPLDAPLPDALPRLSTGLRVMTWNLVHGTRMSVPPRLVPRAFVEARLAHAARVAARLSIDVLALQEADGDARLDRTAHLAARCDLTPVISASEAGHGATLATRSAPRIAWSAPFAHRAWDPKGVTFARVSTAEGREVDVASVHLHAFSAAARHVQIRELEALVRAHHARHGARPLVLAGDLNDDVRGTTRALASTLGLTTTDEQTPTFTDFGLAWRLDWILVSPELEIRAHRVLGPGTSDHRPIVLDVAFRSGS